MSDRPLRILLVDDAPEDALIVRKLLEKATTVRFHTETRQDYDSGLAALRDQTFDACVLDYRLGRDSGLDFLREAVATVPEVPVVMLTGQGDASVDMAALEAGAADYLDKSELTTPLVGRTLRYAVRQAETVRALTASEMRFRGLADGSPALTWIHELDDEEAFFSRSWYTFTGHGSASGLARAWLGEVHPEDRARYAVVLAGVARTGEAEEVEYRVATTDGTYRWLLEKVVPYFGAHGRVAGYAGSAIDITERREAEEQRRLAEAVFNTANEGIMVTDTDGTIVTVNPAFTTITGYTADEAVGNKPSLLRSGRHDRAFYEELWGTLEEDGQWAGEIWNRHKDGGIFVEWLSISRIRDHEGRPRYYVGVFSDVTERKRQEAVIHYQANYDALTELPNRTLFQDRLGRALANSNRHGGRVALMFLDLDHFKPVNDTLGHSAGDTLLQKAAVRLNECVRESDTLARLGGDEFTVILPDIHDGGDAETVARKIVDRLSESFTVEGHEVTVSASVGISLYPDDAADVESLMHNADNAMYKAKEHGRGGWAFHAETLNSEAASRRALVTALHRALAQGDLGLRYQPLVCCGETGTAMAEALMHWDLEDAEQADTASLLRLADEGGFGPALIHWAAHAACRQALAWRKQWPDFRLVLDLSARHRRLDDLTATVESVLDETGLPGDALVLQVPESALGTSGETAGLERLRRRGVCVAAAGFGASNTDLAALNKTPATLLKLEPALVAGLPDDETAARMTKAIVAAARALGFSVVAPGVTSAAQAAFLRDQGCAVLQGPNIMPPLAAGALENTWLAARSTA